MALVQRVRKQLSLMHAYIMTCPQRASLLQQLGSRPHMMSAEGDYFAQDMYSLRDLIDILDSDLADRLAATATALAAHIMGGNCSICSSKGFFCEYCTTPSSAANARRRALAETGVNPEAPIYPFQLDIVTQCDACGGTFHRACHKPAECPKCARRGKRSGSQVFAADSGGLAAAAADAGKSAIG